MRAAPAARRGPEGGPAPFTDLRAGRAGPSVTAVVVPFDVVVIAPAARRDRRVVPPRPDRAASIAR
jgi:hypothetical protein